MPASVIVRSVSAASGASSGCPSRSAGRRRGGRARAERGDQVADLVVDRADAVEMVVVLGDLEHPLAGDVPAPQDVLQERHHVVASLRAAEADDQDRVIAGGRFGSRGHGSLPGFSMGMSELKDAVD